MLDVAFSWNWRDWRWGKCEARELSPVIDRPGRVVGVWWCFGPFAVCKEYE